MARCKPLLRKPPKDFKIHNNFSAYHIDKVQKSFGIKLTHLPVDAAMEQIRSALQTNTFKEQMASNEPNEDTLVLDMLNSMTLEEPNGENNSTAESSKLTASDILDLEEPLGIRLGQEPYKRAVIKLQTIYQETSKHGKAPPALEALAKAGKLGSQSDVTMLPRKQLETVLKMINVLSPGALKASANGTTASTGQLQPSTSEAPSEVQQLLDKKTEKRVKRLEKKQRLALARRDAKRNNWKS